MTRCLLYLLTWKILVWRDRDLETPEMEVEVDEFCTTYGLTRRDIVRQIDAYVVDQDRMISAYHRNR